MADMVARLPDKIIQAVTETISMGSIGVPEDVAEAVRYLVSDEARYVTGALIPVTGRTADDVTSLMRPRLQSVKSWGVVFWLTRDPLAGVRR